MLARHSLASSSEGERVVVLGMAPATIKNRLREAREHGLLMLGILSTRALYDVADLCYVVSRKVRGQAALVVGRYPGQPSCLRTWRLFMLKTRFPIHIPH
jgi:hypothetical protein